MLQETQTFHGRVADDGRVVIPAPLRKELGLAAGSEVVIERDGGGVRVRSYAQALADVQDYCRGLVTSGEGGVDGLIAGRRAEAAREDAEAAAWLADSHPRAGRA